MKNYFQSTIYVLCLFAALFALHIALISYENPFDIYENPLVWVIIVGVVTMVILKEILNVVSIEKAQKLEMEKQGIDPETVDQWAWFKALMKKWTKSKEIEEEEEIILDHNYDGIKELDNSLPPWWLYLFYGTILFAFVYLIRFHIAGDYTQAEEYLAEVKVAEAELEKKKESGAVKVITAETAQILTDEASLSRGKAVFNLNCASCHVADGGGNVGPNLTDEYWILGGGMKNIFNTVANGGRTGKGMVAWKSTLKSTDIEKVSSYVLALQGTTPAKPKAPEGELWEGEE